MSRTSSYPVTVDFSDCDPAGIVYFPNFFRWIDVAARHYFASCGVPPWHQLIETHGIVGTPLVDVKCRFLKPATYGDRLEVVTSIPHWRGQSFVMTHRIQRGEDVLVEATEVRVFARRATGDRHSIEVVPIPDFVRDACGA